MHALYTHEEKKYFECQLCQAKFATKEILKRHMKAVHEYLNAIWVQNISQEIWICAKL